ncbi:MAG: carbohydrate ABC transporter permease [Lachnospiraceae bacterium]|nr:carbohydrate ABC transporter permease [Lachnospiraceae bacterium]
MKKKNSLPKTKEQKLFSWKRRGLLTCLLVSLIILILEGIDNKHTVDYRGTMDIVFAVLWVILELDSILRLVKIAREEGIKQYFKFNKIDFVYLVLSPIAMVCSFAAPALKWTRWIILFKMPKVIAKYNDENVFQLIAKSLALILVALFILPVFNVISTGFSAPGEIVNILPKNFDTFSFSYALSDTSFLKSFGNSFFIVIVGTSIFVFITTMAAYPLSKPDLPGRKWFMLFYMITMYFTGGMATDIILIDALGLMNTIWALILPSVISVYYMLLIKSFYEGLPAELEEAAKIDGASQMYVFLKIVLPLSKSIIATTCSFVVVNFWNNYMNSVLYITHNKEIYPVQMYIRNFLAMDPMDIALDNPTLLSYWDNIEMAYLTLAILPIVCAYPILFRFLKGGVTSGAVKG